MRSDPNPRISTAFRFLGLLFLAALGPYRAAAQDPDPAYRPYYSPDTTRLYRLAVAQRNTVKAHFVLPKTGNSDYRALPQSGAGNVR